MLTEANGGEPHVSVVIPMRNPDHALDRMLPSLRAQTPGFSWEIIVVDNGIGPEAQTRIREGLPGVKFVRQPRPGLALSYNAGVAEARGRIVVFMHHDIVLTAADSLERIVLPMQDENVVATYPRLYLSPEVYATYDFWHRVMFSTLANRCGKAIPTFSGKFDAVRREVLLRIGGFNADVYRVAGEDIDLRMRLASVGRVAATDVSVEHIHGWNRKATLAGILRLERRWGETAGVILRRYCRRIVCHPVKHAGDLSQLLKPAAVVSMLAGVVHPLLCLPGLMAVCVYRLPALRHMPAFWVLTPLLNAILFALFSLGLVEGLVKGRQTM